MRLYLSGRILSTPSLHIHSGGLVSAMTRCSTLSTGSFPEVLESKQCAGRGTQTDWATLQNPFTSAQGSRGVCFFFVNPQIILQRGKS